ncbi:MAG: protein translocase subunit SecD [Pseudomonadota bacterium]|nr:protein translocase subunit SecD [Pseudomonadota bacterium]
MNRYPAWKYVLIVAVLMLSVIYASPNLFGEDLSVQVSRTSGLAVDDDLLQRVRPILDANNLDPRAIGLEEGRLLIRYQNDERQLRARDLLATELGSDYVVALNLAPRTPGWLRAINGRPMALGLDLRGGVHFLLEVDMDAAVAQRVERFESEIRRALREERIRYSGVERRAEGLLINLRNPEDVSSAEKLLEEQFPEFSLTRPEGSQTRLVASLTEAEAANIQEFALQQNVTTLRNRVNELGVAEPLVQRQGDRRIVVQLPGLQDTARAKEILGKTATLEFRLADMDGDPFEAARTGRVPIGTRLYEHRDGRPVLLKRDVIVTGDQLVDATTGFDQDTGGPAVLVTLDGRGARRMGQTTRENLGRQMAVVFIESRSEILMVDGEPVRSRRTVEEVISLATIQGLFSKRFQITGLDQAEAKDLALLLRAGALAAPVDIVEERTVGPSLGVQNVRQGTNAILIGLALVVVFMILYYRVFGVVAVVALIANLVIIVAALSLLQATLTLPGIAGIVLTVGMAVDANVLIFERIREEIRNGNSPQASIHAGYEKAFSTIADANVTTLIAAVVLFGLGSGPVQGFAVTLSIGILTSMFTAIMGTRALINLIYGGRRVSKLAV